MGTSFTVGLIGVKCGIRAQLIQDVFYARETVFFSLKSSITSCHRNKVRVVQLSLTGNYQPLRPCRPRRLRLAILGQGRGLCM